MTNVSRPICLQLRTVPTPGSQAAAGAQSPFQNSANNHRRSVVQTPGSFTPNGANPKQALSPTAASALPSQILPHLFVGAQEQTNRETVNRLNIKYILSLGLLPLVLQQQLSSPVASNQPSLPAQNCSRDFKVRIRSNTPSSTPTSAFVAGQSGQQQQAAKADENKGVKQVRSVHCKCINVADNSEQMLLKFFDEAYAFIEEARRKKCNILIHCLAGISRSPTIAIAYLMRVRMMHWRDAYELVKQCRPQIDPNLSFMGQLRLYNRSLRDSQAPPEHQILANSQMATSKANEKLKLLSHAGAHSSDIINTPTTTTTTTTTTITTTADTKIGNRIDSNATRLSRLNGNNAQPSRLTASKCEPNA